MFVIEKCSNEQMIVKRGDLVLLVEGGKELGCLEKSMSIPNVCLQNREICSERSPSFESLALYETMKSGREH